MYDCVRSLLRSLPIVGNPFKIVWSAIYNELSNKLRMFRLLELNQNPRVWPPPNVISWSSISNVHIDEDSYILCWRFLCFQLIWNNPCKIHSKRLCESSVIFNQMQSSVGCLKEKYANEERYKLSEQKSKIMIFNCRKKNIPDSSDIPYQINSKDLEITSSYTYISVEMKAEHGPILDAAIATARKTLYSLMDAWLHGYNGVEPKVGIKMWNIYVKPRMLFGLESQNVSKGDRAALNQYHKVFLKRIMQLPSRAADGAVYILSGEIPVEADLDKKVLGQLMNILLSSGIERSIAERQLATKSVNRTAGSYMQKEFWRSMDYPLFMT